MPKCGTRTCGPSQTVRCTLQKPMAAFSMWECTIQSISGPA